jgi:hypothetical protein
MPARLLVIILLTTFSFSARSQTIVYPDSVKFIQLNIEMQQVKNGLHGCCCKTTERPGHFIATR